jgi:hypothetical protein
MYGGACERRQKMTTLRPFHHCLTHATGRFRHPSSPYPRLDTWPLEMEEESKDVTNLDVGRKAYIQCQNMLVPYLTSILCALTIRPGHKFLSPYTQEGAYPRTYHLRSSHITLAILTNSAAPIPSKPLPQLHPLQSVEPARLGKQNFVSKS